MNPRPSPAILKQMVHTTREMNRAERLSIHYTFQEMLTGTGVPLSGWPCPPGSRLWIQGRNSLCRL